MCLYETFQEIIFRTIEPFREGTCLAFSGGVDSSLLASIFEEKFGKTTLLSVYFSEQDELDFTRRAAEFLNSPLILEKINLNELEQGVKDTLNIINYDRVALLENCIGFFFIFKYASEYGFKNVLSANGVDELFCGYDVFRRKYHEVNIMDLVEEITRTAIQDKVEIDKLASHFNLKYMSPLLEEDVVEFSKVVPISLKIRNEKDELRKHFIRIVARKKGLPAKVVYRKKRSLQYSSGLHQSLRRLARKKGFTNQKGNAMGYESGVKAYIKTLEKQTIKNPSTS
jgi:asparagine synthase (glutamine-hydrolysing)